MWQVVRIAFRGTCRLSAGRSLRGELSHAEYEIRAEQAVYSEPACSKRFPPGLPVTSSRFQCSSLAQLIQTLQHQSPALPQLPPQTHRFTKGSGNPAGSRVETLRVLAFTFGACHGHFLAFAKFTNDLDGQAQLQCGLSFTSLLVLASVVSASHDHALRSSSLPGTWFS